MVATQWRVNGIPHVNARDNNLRKNNDILFLLGYACGDCSMRIFFSYGPSLKGLLILKRCLDARDVFPRSCVDPHNIPYFYERGHLGFQAGNTGIGY